MSPSGMRDPVITTRKGLFEYLKRYDKHTLEFLKQVTKSFGRPDVIAYVRRDKND